MSPDRLRTTRRAFVGGSVGALVLAGVEPAAAQDEPQTDLYHSKELRERHAIGAIVYALNTSDHEYLASVCESQMFWGVHGEDSWRYASSHFSDHQYTFTHAFKAGQTKTLGIMSTGEEKVLLVQDFALPMGQALSQMSFVRLKKNGDRWKIFAVQEVANWYYEDFEFRQKLVDLFSQTEEDGYWVRSYWAKKGKHATHPEVRVHPEGKTRIMTVGGLISEVSDGGVGRIVSGVFDDFLAKLKPEYTAADFINNSWNHVRVDSKNGMAYPAEQNCDLTLSHPEDRAHVLFDLWLTWFSLHPNDTLKVFTHSEGFHPTILAMMKLKREIEANPNYPIKPKQLEFFFIHPPALGLDKPGLEEIGKHFDEVSSSDCKTLFGTIPEIGVAGQPASEYLLSRWSRRRSWAEEIKRTVEWFIKQGSDIESGGNYEDLAIFSRGVLIDRRLWQVLIRINQIPEVVNTQKVPGVSDKKQHMLLLGREGFGHDRFLKTEEGLKILVDFAKRKN